MPRKTPEERKEIRLQTEARRIPGKPREAHEAARGGVPSLDELTRQRLTQKDFTEFTLTILNETERAAAIMAGAFVERALEEALRGRLIDPGGDIMDDWFHGPLAPFGTFSAKITLGRAVALYGQEMEKYLKVIKGIRNAFAHHVLPLGFSNASVVKELNKLRPYTLGGKRPPKLIFLSASRNIANELYFIGQEARQHKLTVIREKVAAGYEGSL
jgi:hypothetical protein